MSLYEAWRSTASREPRRIALVDHGSGASWSFWDLQQALDRIPRATGPVRAAGRGPGFILSTLQAWRDGHMLLPVESGEDLVSLPQHIPEDICHVKKTSGSTGSGRLVGFSAGQLAADAGQIVRSMDLSPEHPNLGTISLAHSYGFSNLVLTLLLHGIPLHLSDSPFPGAIREILACNEAFILPAVPALWRSWEDAGLDFSHVSLAISAGAPLSLDLERRVLERAGLKIHNFYGASECGGIAFDGSCVLREDETLAGSALSGVDLTLLPDGRLEVRSPAVGCGYLDDPGDPHFRDGSFVTTDLAQLISGSEPQALRLLGRSGDVIHVAGRKISPLHVEEAVHRQPGVKHCLVFGAPSPDQQRGEMVVAVIHLAPGTLLQDVQRGAARLLRAWERPRHWWERPDLEPDARGKLARAQWRGRFLDQSEAGGKG
ncbi:MAG TPA: fatty acid--CoA ligase family protein [Verrucomicrobiales bacterium]|nr:fatty acid--CoA ligase family protein [Verrucomicrobiales bacterium]